MSALTSWLNLEVIGIPISIDSPRYDPRVHGDKSIWVHCVNITFHEFELPVHERSAVG